MPGHVRHAGLWTLRGVHTKLRRRLLAAAALASLLSGCHHPRSSDGPIPPQTVPPVGASALVAPPPTPPGKAVIYVVNPKATGDDDPLMARTVTLRHPETPARSAVSALLRDPHTPLPAGTSLRGLTIDSGVATLDFSRSPVNEVGGEGGQSNSLTALGRTLGQFPEIGKFQISIRGRPTTTFGEFTTDGPIDVTRPGDVASPGSPRPEGKP